MGKEKFTRVIALVALAFAVIGVSVAFAAMSQTLTINGTATVSPAFSVKFANLSAPVLVGTASVTTAPTLTATHIGNYAVKLTQKNDSVTYTFDIKNTGTINATLSTLTKATPTCTGTATDTTQAASDATTVCSNLTYTLTYTTGGAAVQANDTLDANTTKNVTLKISYNSDTLPIDDVNVTNLDITLVYNSAA
jgi:hypothetical protein